MVSDEAARARRALALWYGALLLLTTLAFRPTFGAGFLQWDDQHYVEENALLHDVSGLKKFWNPISRGAPQYYPLLFTSYWLEYHLWGLQAGGYHAVNLVLHLANVGLVLLLMRSFGASGWVAALAAGVFAVHPVQVASVAWIAERKNTLSGLFYLLSFLLYLRHRRTGSWSAYAACLGAFLGALLSKTQTATLPISLLLADWCLQRTGRLRTVTLGGLVARLLPMLALCVLAAVVTVYFEQNPYQPTFTLLERILVTANASWFYVLTFLAPLRLSPIYGSWDLDPSEPIWWVAVVAWPAAIAAVVYWRRRISDLILWGIAHFFVVLLPVLGFVSFNFQLYSLVADHYLYLACIGGGLAVAVCCEQLAGGAGARSVRHAAVAGCAGLLLAGCGVQTYREATHWHDNLSFWMRVRERQPAPFLGDINLGHHYAHEGQWAEAARFYQRATEAAPWDPGLFRHYANALRQAQGPAAAIAVCTARLQQKPRFAAAAAYLERAISYDQLGDRMSASSDYAQVRKLEEAAKEAEEHADHP
jgi:hypothetical protein